MSSLFDRKKIIPRFKLLAFIMLALGAAVVFKALYIAIAEKEYWNAVSSRLSKEDVDVLPVRGNIYSHDGRLMASSLPEYLLLMDFHALDAAGNDSIFMENLDSICQGLHEVFPARTAKEFRANLLQGRDKKSRNWKIWPRRISHFVYSEVKKLPVFKMHQYKGGFHVEEFNSRQHPHGSLALRTIGTLYGAKDSAKCGLELYYDNVLRGEVGKTNRRKVMNRYLDNNTKEPVNGSDIVTTLDVDIQDLTERALYNELRDINAEEGVAIVMEVETGDVKAICNLSRLASGGYAELKNNAVSMLLEPGSVFKTASMLVALDDGMCDTTEVIHTGDGIRDVYGSKMRDHNWTKGGCGTITMVGAMERSSNIGVSAIIDKYYHRQPEKFVEGLYRTGIHDDLMLPFPGYATPQIRMPARNGKGNLTNWYATTLSWMSIGYETQVPPISTLTFYNAIANGGKMMRPRFVKAIMREGEVLQEMPPVVQRERIASEQAVEKVQKMLRSVVHKGTGKMAGSKSFGVAGKTGTAQISKGAAGYKAGVMEYLISFCGYFPTEKPQYSCIVCIRKQRPASGGIMCGKVFHDISEGIMANSIRRSAADALDEPSQIMPNVKNGNVGAAGYVLDELGISTDSDFSNTFRRGGETVWGNSESKVKGVALRRADTLADKDSVPDVYGMGARDAVYLLESCGLKVQIHGRGKVQSQSLAAGDKVKKGAICHIVLG